MMGKWGNSGFQPHIRLVALTLELDRTSYVVEMIITLQNMSVGSNWAVCVYSLDPTHICALLSSSRYTQILMKMTSGQKKRAGRGRKYIEHTTHR